MLLLQRIPRNAFAVAFQQATAAWNVDSMAGTAEAVDYVQRNAEDPSREPLRRHAVLREGTANSAPVVGTQAPFVSGMDGSMFSVTEEQVQRMWSVVHLQALSSRPDEVVREIRYRQAMEARAAATDPDEIHLLNLYIQNELRLRLSLAPILPVDRSGMKTVEELIRADNTANLPYASQIGREMARLYRDRHRRDPSKTEINPATNHSENMYAGADTELFITAKNIVLSRLSRASHVPPGQTRIKWAAGGSAGAQ